MDINKFLGIALEEAKIAFNNGDYPIGALIVTETGEILTKDHNRNKTNNDITAHAEILCLQNAGISNTNKDLCNKTCLITSLEPCYGCSFFIDRTNITQIVWALTDPHIGGISKLKSDPSFKNFFQNIELVIEPIEKFSQESKDLMRKFFLKKGRQDTAKLYV